MVKGLRDAVGFLTRVPVHPGPDLGRALPWFPLVGAAVGGLGAAVRWATGPLSPLAATVLAVVAVVTITGGLHEDGVADLADALPAPDRDTRFQILKDPATGSFGVLALGSLLLLRVSLLAPFPPARFARAMVAAHALGRATSLVLGRVLPSASDGLGRKATGRWSPALVVSCLLTVLGAGLLAGPWAVFIAAILAVTLALLLVRRLGGITGDGMGAGAVAGELGVLAGAVLWR